MENSRIPSKSEIVDYIKSKYPRTRTADQQAEMVIHSLKSDADYLEDRKITTTELLDNVDSARRGQIENLVEKVGLFKEFKPEGNDRFFYHGRLGENYYSLSQANVDEVKQDIENFLLHCRQDSDVKEFVSDELNVESTVEAIRSKLWRDDFNDLVQEFDSVVKKIQRNTDVNPSEHGYDRMGWRRRANRYQVTSQIEEVAAA